MPAALPLARGANDPDEAARIVDTADGEADRLRRDCDAYVDTTLRELEETQWKLQAMLSASGRRPRDG